MKKISIILVCLTLWTYTISQDFIGKISYDIDYDLDEHMESQRSMLPTQMTTFISKNASRIEQETMIGVQTVISNHKNNSSVLLMNLMGQKVSINIPYNEDKTETKEVNIKYLEDEKMIVGYACKKAIYSSYSSKKEDTISIIVYYTPEISAKYNQQFKELKGLPLEYSVITQGMTLNFVANEIIQQKVAKSLFKTPKDYNSMSLEDFQKMMGGS
jgi:GLPGLI family protein